MESVAGGMGSGERIERGRAGPPVEEDGLWHAVFRDAGAAIAVLDRDFRLVRVNPALAGFVGREGTDLAGSGITDLVHPDDRGALLEALRALIDGGEACRRLELRFLRKDGSAPWGLLTVSPGCDEAGRRSFLIGVIQDIDDRKRAEAAATASESRLRALIDAVPAYVSEIGADHRYRIVNRFYEQMCRGERAALEGRHVRDVLGDPAYRRLAERIALALAGQQVTYDDTLDFGRGPRRLRVTYIPRAGADGEVGSFFVFGIDDTERATAERERHEALQRLEEKTRMLDAVLSATADSISMFDRDGRYLYASRRAARALGLTQADLVGRRLQDLGMPAEVVRQIDGHRMLAAATGQPMTAEINVPHAERTRHFEYTMSPVKNGEGAAVAVVVTGRDMTARKQIEDGIRRSLAEKEALLREVHHRVKNNMQVIVSLLNLQSQNFRQPELRQSHEELGNRIRALALVHQMLTDGPTLERIDLAHYAERLCGQLRRFYLGNSERVAVGLSLQPVTVGMDEAVPLGLILNELLSNALAHAFPDDRAGAVTVTLQAVDGGFDLSVADDGVGFIGDQPPDGPGLGVRLVGVLTRQIGGELRYRAGGPGTSATIHWARPAG